MKTLYEKLQDALAGCDGNVMLDPGVKFFVDEIAKDLNTGVCERCLKIVSERELERNAGICAKCCLKEIL